MHRRAWSGSGGVGFLVRNDILTDYACSVLDDSYEGILWIKLEAKHNNVRINACVCYLPPDGSSRTVDPHDFYETLIAQVSMYQNEARFFLCGDFNSRCGSEADFIQGVDTVPERQVVDFTENSYGSLFIDFLINTNMCMLNGRNDGVNDFTYFGHMGQSVVDYVVMPYESLEQFSNLNVKPPYQVFESAGLVGELDPSERGVLCDHALLSWVWDLTDVCGQASGQNAIEEDTGVCYTRYNTRNVPDNFLMSNEAITVIDEMITKIVRDEYTQGLMDEMYVMFCEELKSEMNEKLEKRIIVLDSSVSQKRRRTGKPWWNDHLSELWNKLTVAERRWSRAYGQIKARLKADKCAAQRQFDKCVQSTKRTWWRQQQELLLAMQTDQPGEFWKRIGELGVAQNRKKNIPWEVVLEDGTIVTDKQKVLSYWESKFKDLYNPESGVGSNDNVNQDIPQRDVVDNRMNDIITWQEILYALLKAKDGKSPGFDEIPTEVLRNETAKRYLLVLFNKCFESGIVPSAWAYGIVNPIPKNSTSDPRSPMNYRGIVLASSMYKLYCGVLNVRLQKWAEENGVIADEQNGFRQKRSCIDQLSCLTNIIEGRKITKRSTFVAFVDFSKAYDRVNRSLLWKKLDRLGINGKMMNALKALYKNVKYCVRVNGRKSDWFDVECGLRQGCLVSPLLFNMYINDLVQEIKDLNVGVQIDDELLCVLLYADDLCLIAANECDMQMMLDVLSDWCDKWNMKVNSDKTKIVHFRPACILKTSTAFSCGGASISITDRYKYLGLILTEHLDYSITAKMVAQAASRALGLLIAKDKCNGGMPFKCYTKLYESLVQSVIDYGAAIWGTQEYSCISAVQNRACRYFMGLGKYAPNIALQGDTGWKHPYHKQWLCVIRLWCRLVNMSQSRINKRVFAWALRLGKKNWCWRVTEFCKDRHLANICNTELYLSGSSVRDKVDKALWDHCSQVWNTKLNRDSAIRGQGRNKLRTYKLFKNDICAEPYLSRVINKRERSCLAKLRCGVAPLHIETGRYIGLPVHERRCPICDSDVESEIHFMMHCSIYVDLREQLFLSASNIDPSFLTMSDVDKMCFLLSNEFICTKTAKTLNLMIKRRREYLFH